MPEVPIIATRLSFSIRFSALALASVAGIALAQDSREKLERLNQQETAINAQQGQNLNQFARLLTVLERVGRDPPPALLVSPRDAVDAARAAILIRALTPELQRRAKIYAVQAHEIARQRRLADVASEALFTSESQTADAQADADPLMPDTLEIPPVAPARLTAPTQGPILHGFGQSLAGGGRAAGLTILATAKAPVNAPGDGLVQYVGPVKGWGTILILRLAGGYNLVLAGLDRVNVHVGQDIVVGAAVGSMPDGHAGPPELYLEVRVRGEPVDPGRWLKPAEPEFPSP